MLDILGITMKDDGYYRVLVTANDDMKKDWLNVLNEDGDEPYTYEEALDSEWGTGTNELVVEIEVEPENDMYNVVYYFDDYEDLGTEISDEEFKQLVGFVKEWDEYLPDNSELCLGDSEWYDKIPNIVTWK